MPRNNDTQGFVAGLLIELAVYLALGAALGYIAHELWQYVRPAIHAATA